MDEQKRIPVIDSHTHVEGYRDIEEMVDIMDSCGFDAMNVLSLPGLNKLEQRDTLQNITLLLFKLMHPGRVYAYASLYRFIPDTDMGSFDFAKQVEMLIGMGFDGIKMIEGKPTMRKDIGIPLDNKIYDSFYSLLERERIPLTFHVADPEANWDENLIAKTAKASGWFYGDGTFPSKEDLHREAEGVLQKFPELLVTFAHFYNRSADMGKAASIFDRWPNVHFDITPGVGMYVNFAKNQSGWHDFFTKYQDRIVFGTDNMTGYPIINPGREGIKTKKVFMKKFLETYEDTGEFYGVTSKGIGLDSGVLEKIYSGNFRKIAGDKPARVDKDLALKECDRILKWSKNLTDGGFIFDNATEIKKRIENL